MQLEKYLYHLSRWGQAGEEKLNKRYAGQLPKDLRIKIVNPSGMIIIGRDKLFTNEQRTDFEVIRRKFRNVLDIMTYDDLLRRLMTIRDRAKREPKTQDKRMTDPDTTFTFAPGRDPGSTRIVWPTKWTSVGMATPRSAWPRQSARWDCRTGRRT